MFHRSAEFWGNISGQNRNMGPLIFFQKQHSDARYIVCFANMRIFICIIIMLGDFISVPMKCSG